MFLRFSLIGLLVSLLGYQTVVLSVPSDEKRFDRGITAMVSGEYQQALLELESLANQQHAGAQSALGVMYLHGMGMGPDTERAMKWFRQAAEGNDIYAQTLLGKLYMEGQKVQQSFPLAKKWLNRAVKQGGDDAREALFVITEHQLSAGISAYKEKDYSAARGLLEPLAEQGFSRAQSLLGNMYSQGLGDEKDLKEGMRWRREAAMRGDREAQYHLGLMYSQGDGVAENSEKAIHWLEKAADPGVSEAQYKLGVMYYQGKGVTKNEQEALRWYRMAGEQGHAEAQYNLGVKYTLGASDTPADSHEALRWFKMSAKQGNHKAQHNLGLMYARGLGVNKNPEQSLVWLKKAAEGGVAKAQFKLSQMYQRGDGVDKDPVQADAWMNKAADAGLSSARYAMAVSADRRRSLPKASDIASQRQIVNHKNKSRHQSGTEVMAGKSWFLSRPASHYTVQLTSGRNEEGITDLIREYALKENYAYFKTHRYNKRPWYAMVHGDYATYKKALLAVQRLPAALQSSKPWIRKMASLQKKVIH